MNELRVTGKQKIGNIEFTGIEGGFGKEKKAMTVKDIAGIHGKEVKAINQAINMNRIRFKEGLDIIDLKSVVNQIDLEDFGFTQNAINRSNSIYILSERGYAKLLKILEDDTAWEIYDELVDNYFSMREQVKIPNTPRELAKLALAANEETNQRLDAIEEKVSDLKENQPLPQGEYSIVSSRINKRVYEVADAYSVNRSDRKTIGLLYKDINSGVKRIAGVGARTQLRAKHYDIVMEFINSWEPSSVTKFELRQTKMDI
ncbi:ORF6C domain-containing protein [Enterococcus durans]|uniref:ORF6N domain-containing protein n=2 Tax=Enterococcus TaxID=1350 RepID=UPI001EDE1C9B|nr:ORF6C domain-containing protein [Enterococcus durans]MCG3448618.1 ORF6C domain-containing protein [Enterococcus durans]